MQVQAVGRISPELIKFRFGRKKLLASQLSDALSQATFIEDKLTIDRFDDLVDFIDRSVRLNQSGKGHDSDFGIDIEEGDDDFTSSSTKLLRVFLANYLNRDWNADTIESIAHRVAACRNLFTVGKLPEFTLTSDQVGWQPAEIESSSWVPTKAGEGKVFIELVLRLWDGIWGGIKLPLRISHKLATGYLPYKFGFPLNRKVHHTELVGCRLGVYAVLRRYGPRVDEFYVNSSMKSHNNKLRLARSKPCSDPARYNWECHRCYRGYRVSSPGTGDKCWRAVHTHSYYLKFCSYCNRSGYFDPASNTVKCMSCINKEFNHRTMLEV